MANKQPLVTFLFPTGGETVSGVLPITVQATDPDGKIAWVYLVQSDPLTAKHVTIAKLPGNDTGLYTFDWDTTTVPDGLRLLSAAAIDNGGKRMVDRAWIIIKNAV